MPAMVNGIQVHTTVLPKVAIPTPFIKQQLEAGAISKRGPAPEETSLVWLI